MIEIRQNGVSGAISSFANQACWLVAWIEARGCGRDKGALVGGAAAAAQASWDSQQHKARICNRAAAAGSVCG